MNGGGGGAPWTTFLSYSVKVFSLWVCEFKPYRQTWYQYWDLSPLEQLQTRDHRFRAMSALICAEHLVFQQSIFTLYNVCAVPWGCAVQWGCSVPWGYHDACGGYLEYHGGYMINVGDILSTMGCSVPWGISWVPWGLSWVPWGSSVPRGI